MALAATIPVVRKVWIPEVAIERKAAEGGQPQMYTFRFTSDAIDRDGEIISADGWDFSAYEKNPVILDSHNSGGFFGSVGVEVILGRAIPPMRQVDNAWEADIVFADTPRGQIAKQLVDGGFLRTVSVGFRSQEQLRKPNEPLVHLTKELLEISLVAIPSNRDAVRVRSADGVLTRDFNGTLQAAERRDDLRERYRDMFTVLRHCIDACIECPEMAVPDKIRECDVNLGQFHATMNQWVAEWLALPPIDGHGERALSGGETVEKAPGDGCQNIGRTVSSATLAWMEPIASVEKTPGPVEKGGRALSAANLARIKKAHDHHDAGLKELKELIASVEAAKEEPCECCTAECMAAGVCDGTCCAGQCPAGCTCHQHAAGKAVAPFKDLPLAERDVAWDAPAAAKRVAAWASSDGSGDKDKMDWPKYRKAFLWYDAENQEVFGGYKLPFADVVDGGLKAVPKAIFAVAQRLDQTDIPAADVAKVRGHLAKYYEKLDMTAPWEAEGVERPPEQKLDQTGAPDGAAEEPQVLDLDLALLGQLIRR